MEDKLIEWTLLFTLQYYPPHGDLEPQGARVRQMWIPAGLRPQEEIGCCHESRASLCALKDVQCWPRRSLSSSLEASYVVQALKGSVLDSKMREEAPVTRLGLVTTTNYLFAPDRHLLLAS